MQSVSTKFLTAIRQSGKRKTVVDGYFDGAPVFTDIPIASGSISVDRNSFVRRTGTLQLGDPRLTPTALQSAGITPYGLELVVRTGVTYPNGLDELVQLGVFGVEEVLWADNDASPVAQVRLYDRGKILDRAVMLLPIDYSGWLLQDAAEHMVTRDNAAPNVTVNFDGALSNPRLPGGTVWQGSRVSVLQKLADSIGADVYFDVDGVMQFAPTPTITPAMTVLDAVWTIDAGDTGVMVQVNRTLSRTGVYNLVLVQGAANQTGGGVYAYAGDNDPTSPTWNQGPFGNSPLRVERPELTTYDQCLAAAQAILADSIGLNKSLAMDLLSNPALEGGDIVLVEYVSGGQELHIVDSFTVPIGAGTFTMSTRTDRANV